TAFLVVITLAGVSFIALQQLLDLTLYQEDYLRIGIIIVFYSLTFLEGMAILEALIRSRKLCLLMQSVFTFTVLLLSGGIIPIFYFPGYVQSLLSYIFAAQSYKWLQEIILNERFYADYLPLSLMTGAGMLILIAMSLVKERYKP